MKDILNDTGIKCEEASNGKEGLIKCKKEEFDIMNKFFKGNWGFVSIDGFNGCTNLSNCNP